MAWFAFRLINRPISPFLVSFRPAAAANGEHSPVAGGKTNPVPGRQHHSEWRVRHEFVGGASPDTPSNREQIPNAFISGSVEKAIYDRKALEIRDEVERIKQEEMSESRVNASFIETAEAVFNLTQRAAETWRISNWTVKRELLEIFSLKCELDDASLCLHWNKPFDHLANCGEGQSTVPIWN